MDLEQLRAQARAVASRMEARLNSALTANRELTVDEEQANTADEAELAELKGRITAAEQAGADDKPADPADPVAAAVAAERTRVLALVDLCPASVVATPLRAAIDKGEDAGAFAIGLTRQAKARGASIADLKAGAVQPEQLPLAGKGAIATDKVKTGAEQATGILALAAKAGVRAASHLLPKG